MARTIVPQPTPNPNALRFGLGEDVVGSRSLSFADAAAARDVPWAAALLGIPGVASVFAVKDFVTVTKSADASWDAIVPVATEVLEQATFAPPA
jgi:hypothetical protein